MSSWPEVQPKTLPMEIRKGTELNGKYVVVDFLGSGGFGTVWKATDKLGSRDVAIKRLKRARDLSTPQAVLEEAENTKKLTGHKNIVQLLETFQEANESFLVTEFVDGGSLQDLMKKHVLSSTWIDQEEAVDYIKQLFEALIFAHSAGIYHRDITPSNILITGVGVLKLADFGLAKAMSDDLAVHSGEGFAGTGTIQYMSAEQARGESLNHLTDIMSVGIVAHILITGKHPFNHPSGVLSVSDLIKDTNYACPLPLGVDGKPVKPIIGEVLRRLLYKDKMARYQSLVEPLSLLTKDDSVQCRQCLHQNPKAHKFCSECGQKLAYARVEGQVAGPARTAEQITAAGFSKTKMNDWDGAISDYEEALRINSAYAPASANLGFALNRKGEYRAAIDKALIGLKAAQDDGVRHRLFDVLAFAHYSLNEPHDAIKNYTLALQLRDNPRSLVNRAEAYAATNNIPAAWDDVLAALDIDEEYLPATRLQKRLERLI